MGKNIKRIGNALFGLLVVLAMTITVLSFVGWRQVRERVKRVSPLTSVPADSTTVAYGRHLIQALGCIECHGDHLQGTLMVDVPPFRATASNLTSGQGGVADMYKTDAAWDLAIRYGVKPDGRRLMSVMPSRYYHGMSNEDAAAMIAYIKSMSPIDNQLPTSKIKALGFVINAMSGGGLLVDVEGALPHLPWRAPEVSKRYGNYLAHITCIGCHGDNLLGGEHADPSGPAGPSLGIVAAWTLDGFKKTMRSGINPSGREIDPRWMPWESYRFMNDTELEALYIYLGSLLDTHQL